MAYSTVTDYKRTISAGVFVYDPPNDSQELAYDDTLLGVWITDANKLINEYLGTSTDYTTQTYSLKIIEKQLVFMEWQSRLYRSRGWFNSTKDKDQEEKKIPENVPMCMEITEAIKEKLDYIKNQASQRSLWIEEHV
jgi:hypothetical protein